MCVLVWFRTAPTWHLPSSAATLASAADSGAISSPIPPSVSSTMKGGRLREPKAQRETAKITDHPAVPATTLPTERSANKIKVNTSNSGSGDFSGL